MDIEMIFFWFCYGTFQEEQASLTVTGKGGEQVKVEVDWTKENVAKIDRVSGFTSSIIMVYKYYIHQSTTVPSVTLRLSLSTKAKLRGDQALAHSNECRMPKVNKNEVCV